MILAWLVLAEVAVLRAGELLYARRTARLLRERGARLVRQDGMGLIVALHALWFAACAAEAWQFGERFGWWTGLGILLATVGLFLRFSSMEALAWRWNTRLYVLPEAPLVASGPYAVARHPIYTGVWLELAGIPLALGLWRTALVASALHVAVLARRIRLEEQALGLR